MTFSPKVDYLTGTQPEVLVIGDLNGDGWQDVAVTNIGANTVSILLGNGTGAFGAKTDFSTGVGPAGVAMRDLNADGRPDLAVANTRSNTVSVLLGTGSGGFGAKTDFVTANWPNFVAIGDLNGDGKPDLVVTDNNSSSVSVFLGTGAGAFGAKSDFAVGSTPNQVAIADLSGDGKLDLAVANGSGGTVSVLLGNGAGGFGPRTAYASGSGGASSPVSVAVGDVSGDGKPDLVVGNANANTVSVLYGNGTGGFGGKTDFAIASDPFSVAIGDVSGDGKPDLVVTNFNSNTVSVLLGDGIGGFAPKTDYATGDSPNSVALGDLNGDSRPDLVTANFGANTLSALLQPAYVWIGGASAPWTTPTSWSPTRNSPATNDVMVFNGGGSVTATSIPNQTIGQLLLTNNSNVVLYSTVIATLTMSGGSGTDFSVGAGSYLTLRQEGSNVVGVNLRLLGGATADIFGTIFDYDWATIDAVDANSIIFESGSTFIEGQFEEAFGGHPFTTSGTPNTVHFLNGSTINTQSPNSIFGLAAPNSKVVLDPGSVFIDANANGNHVLDFSGRTYGGFTFQGGSSSPTGAGALAITNLTVTQGSLNIGMTGTFSLGGNVTVNPGAALGFTAAAPAMISFVGASTQTITVNGTLNVNATETLVVDNPNGMSLGSNVTLPNGTLQFIAGNVTTGANTLTIASTANLTGAQPETGWVVGKLRRSVPASGARTFDIGTGSDYLPIELQVNGLASAFDMTSSTTTPDHPQLSSSGINPSKSANRYWTLTPATTPTFTNYSAKFNFAGGDIDGGANTANFAANRYSGGTWSRLVAGTRTSTSTQATGTGGFGDFAVGEAVSWTITASAGANGSISPSGAVPVVDGADQAFTITPATCYNVANVLVDTVPQGAITSYTFAGVTTNHTISATYAIKGPYAVTFTNTPTAGGSISGPTSVACGSNPTYTIAPNPCYTLAGVTVNGTPQTPVSTTVQVNNVQGPVAIVATYTLNGPYAVTFTNTPAAGGSISGPTSVACGSNPTYTIAPNACYTLTGVTVNGTLQSPVSTTVLVNNVQGPVAIVATYTLKTFTIATSSGANGSISPSNPSVACGANQTFTITPNACYSIATLTVDSSPVTPATSYTFTSVQIAGHTIAATFSLNGPYTITTTAGAGGSISPTNPSVACGTNQSFTITSAACYHIADVLVDNVSQGAIANYTFTSVGAARTIAASFAIDVETITAIADANGSISPSGPTSVNCGSDQAFTITPAAGYEVDDVLVDLNSVGPLTSYTFTGVTGPHTIEAAFASCLSIAAVRPSQCGNIDTVRVTVTGTCFQPGAIASMRRTGQTPITGGVSYVNSNTLHVAFNIIGRLLGPWDVRVTNTNGVNYTSNAAFTIVSAIDAVSPTKSDNTATCQLTVSGCGFAPGATIKLTRSGVDIVGSSPLVQSPAQATAQFAFSGQALGLWDVVVTNPGGGTWTLPQSFELQATQCGRLTMAVIPPCPNVLPSGMPKYKVEFGLDGTATWKGIAFVELEASSNVDYLQVAPEVGGQSGTFSLSPNGSNRRSILLRVADNLVAPLGGYTVTLRRNTGHLWQDQEKLTLSARLYQLPTCRADIGAVVAEHVKQAALQLHYVATWPTFDAGFEDSLRVRLTPLLLANNAGFAGLFQSNPDQVAAQSHHLGLVVKSVGQALDALGGIFPASDTALYHAAFWDSMYNRRGNDPSPTLAFEAYEEDAYRAVASPPAPAVDFSDDASPGPLTVSTSADPNAKSGPSGTASTHPLNQRQPLAYQVEFANKPIATAPAQNVVITDQLDVTKLDLTTFRFGTITFGDSVVVPPPGLKTYATSVDLRPAKNVVLWIDEKLDMGTGLLTCTFRSRDPVTGLQPEDAQIGFLPPDHNPPEGEGSVSYYVSPLASVASGTQVTNGARIVFDTNPYIDTAVWKNLYDFDPPSSHVNSLQPLLGSKGFVVSWSGADGVTGIYDYSVYVSKDGGPYASWLRNTTSTSGLYTGDVGHTYGFYSTARDSAGNAEAAHATADATTLVRLGAETGRFELSFAGAEPNPTRGGGLTVAFTLPDESPASIDVLDIAGRIVAHRDIGAMGPGSHRVNLAQGVQLAPGIYHLRMVRGGRVITRKVAVLQ